MYPTILYIDSIEKIEQLKEDYMPKERLTGSVISSNNLSKFIMDCVESNRPRESSPEIQEMIDTLMEDHDAVEYMLKPELILGELEAALELII